MATAKKKRGQNQGSVYRGKDGRWRAIVPAKYFATGKRHMIVGSARAGTNTSEAISRKLAESLAGTVGDSIVASRETVKSFLARWLESVAMRIRPKTLEGYRHAVDRLIVPAIGSIKLQALEPHHVTAMMIAIQRDGKAARSVAYARTVLRIALRDAKRQGIVPKNVADREYVDPPNVPKSDVHVHDAAAVALILDELHDPASRLLLATIIAFGLRVGEALGLRWRDVDLQSKSLRINRALQRQLKAGLVFVEVKTSRSRRALRIPDVLIDDFKGHRVAQLEFRMKVGDRWTDHDLVFPARLGSPMDPRNALRVFHRAQVRAKVPRKGLHKLRHSAATILLARGVPLDVVSDILGHSSIRVTADTYSQFVIGRQDQAAGVMDEIVGRGKSK